MASYTRREVVRRSVEYVIPSGDAMAEFNKAYVAAVRDYRQRNGIDENAALSDDWSRVDARDDEVVIAFEVKEATR